MDHLLDNGFYDVMRVSCDLGWAERRGVGGRNSGGTLCSELPVGSGVRSSVVCTLIGLYVQELLIDSLSSPVPSIPGYCVSAAMGIR